MSTPYKLVRNNKGLPLTGVVLGEDKAMSGAPLWKVAVYGYNPNKPEYWLKSDCREMETCPSYIDIKGWLTLGNR